MNQKKKEDPKKQSPTTKKTKTTQTKKGSTTRRKKNVPKPNKQTQAKRPPSQKSTKKPEHKPQKNRKPEVPFMSKATIEDEWTIENIERYVLAVRKAYEKIPETEKGEIDLREIWVNSSLPADLIMKIIIEHAEKIGIKKNSVSLDGKVLY